MFLSVLRELTSKKLDLDTFRDNLLAKSHADTFSTSEFTTCSKTSRFFLASKMLVSSANNLD